MLFTYSTLLISIHAPREGGDGGTVGAPVHTVTFQSTPPARGATHLSDMRNGAESISIHAPREGGRQRPRKIRQSPQYISIHAPREGGDWFRNIGEYYKVQISIHAPREGGDSEECTNPRTAVLFQSTPPARGATMIWRHFDRDIYDFNPRPPRGGRQ